MINQKIAFLLACTILFSMTSCKRPRINKTSVEEKKTTEIVVKKDSVITPVVATIPETKAVETPKKIEKILVKVDDIDFNYVKLKSKVNYKDNQNDLEASANFRIKKDSAIWFSINMVIEVSRGVITHDSIHFFVFDQKTFKRNYYDLSLDSLSNKFNFDLKFGLLQSLLVGNIPVPQNDEDSVAVAENGHLIFQDLAPILLENYITSNNNKLKKLTATPESGNGKMTVQYDNYLPINSFLFPQNDTVEIVSQKDGQALQTTVSLQHTKVEFVNENPGFVFRRK